MYNNDPEERLTWKEKRSNRKAQRQIKKQFLKPTKKKNKQTQNELEEFGFSKHGGASNAPRQTLLMNISRKK